MLTDATKKKINTARDILVGVVPVPTSQVEQITLAMIYKFMSDLDKKARDLGDTSGFFANGYEKYSWDKLMDKSLGARERVKLYSEGLEKMSLNPHIPQLFRDIFKNAFLRFNNPETLKMFLDTIDQFEYDHSEELGNAFEYLLQVMGSQGDAGQFRTPRHIIDFIVEVVEPKKIDKILDPACGTAGFLIAAYKYLKKQGLQSDELKELSENFVGYDISSDMQRLSLVNMYLHNFPDPHIYEYDSLTSEERWDDEFDVILANPPFMSPKGGIKPHSRFSVPSKRAEVLFVDYIMEHLTTRGKAGVIVPEGIIFQSQNAYKDLRKMMVDDDFLWAVVSLPSGVFQPYSGVKTSILLFDREIAKKTNKILFVKVENDGYDLGAQRRAIREDDLPVAKALLKAYKQSVLEGKELDEDTVLELGGSTSDKKQMQSYGYDLSADDHIELSLIINKAYHEIENKKIREAGEYNLSVERYKTQKQKSSYEYHDFLDLFSTITPNGKLKKSEFLPSGSHPVIDQSNDFISGFSNDEELLNKVEKPVIIFGDHTRIFKYVDFDFVAGADGIKILELADILDPRFAYFLLRGVDIKNQGYSRHFSLLKRKKLPVPPLSVQQEIVAELDRYQKIIDGARQVVENYQPSFVIEDDWEWVELGEISSIYSGGTPSKSNSKFWDGNIPWISPKDMKSIFITDSEDYVTEDSIKSSSTKVVEKDTLLCVVRSSILKHTFPVAIAKRQVAFNQDLKAIEVDKSKIHPYFLLYFLKQSEISILHRGIKPGVTVQSFYSNFLEEFKVPLPNLNTQRRVVEKVNLEIDQMDSLNELITSYENKIDMKISGIWEE